MNSIWSGCRHFKIYLNVMFTFNAVGFVPLDSNEKCIDLSLWICHGSCSKSPILTWKEKQRRPYILLFVFLNVNIWKKIVKQNKSDEGNLFCICLYSSWKMIANLRSSKHIALAPTHVKKHFLVTFWQFAHHHYCCRNHGKYHIW